MQPFEWWMLSIFFGIHSSSATPILLFLSFGAAALALYSSVLTFIRRNNQER